MHVSFSRAGLTGIATLLATCCVSHSINAQTLPSSEQPNTDCAIAQNWQEPDQPSTHGKSLNPLENCSSSQSLEHTTVSRDSVVSTTVPLIGVGTQEFTIPTHSSGDRVPSTPAVIELAQVSVPVTPDVNLPGGDVDIDDQTTQFVDPLLDPQPPDIFEPSPSTPPEAPVPQLLPPPPQLLDPSLPSPTTPDLPSEPIQETITVERFEFDGNTAFSDEQLAEVTQEFTGRPITFAELLSARTAVTKLYTDNGYVTSGAFIPTQTLTSGVVTIQIVEGGLEEIEVSGLRRLRSGYVRSRLEIATEKPLNVPRLLEALRLLQLDPLIENISAELSTGSGPGTSVLLVQVTEANTWSYQLFANNGRSPSVGSFRRGASLTQGNLLGFGDSLSFTYTNTDGSDGIDIGYTLPINPRNGTLSLSYGNTSSEVIEDPFNILDIQSESRYLDITFRQPIVQTPTEEFALGLTASRRESETVYLEELFGEAQPFPTEGAEDGETNVSALRFFQEWTKRSARQVIALRSQFSLGIGAFDATVNGSDPQTGDPIPDSQFFSWRGQAQWVRLLAPDTLLLVRGDVQLADRVLLPIERFGLGGQGSVRGYRQDVLLTDNGAFASAEVRLPILRIPEWQGILLLTPFIDIGTTWNSSGREDPDPSSLIGAGLGLQWQQGDRFTVRLDWGIPLISVDSRERSWQENGIYFSITVNPF